MLETRVGSWHATSKKMAPLAGVGSPVLYLCGFSSPGVEVISNVEGGGKLINSSGINK